MKRIKLLLSATIILAISLLNAESKKHYASKIKELSNNQYTFKIFDHTGDVKASISLADPCVITPEIVKAFENSFNETDNGNNLGDTTQENKFDLVSLMRFVIYECKNPSLR